MQGRSVAEVLPMVFGEQCNSLQEIAYTAAPLSVQGYVTLPPASFGHKHKQYMYINNRCIRAGQIGKLVNSLYRSVMLKLEQPDIHQRKATHQYPAFALQINCPYSSYDVTSDPDKAHVEFADWPAVLEAVQTAVLSAWHSVIGDKMLAEMLQQKQTTATPPAEFATASASTGWPEPQLLPTAVQQLPSSELIVRNSSPATFGQKHKRNQTGDNHCFTESDEASANSLVSTPAADAVTDKHLQRGLGRMHGPYDSATGMQDCSPLLTHDLRPPAAAPRGLLSRLQSSVKLKFAQTTPQTEQHKTPQPFQPVPRSTHTADDLQLAALLDGQPPLPLSEPFWKQDAIQPPCDSASETPQSTPIASTSKQADGRRPQPQQHQQQSLREHSRYRKPHKRRAVSAPPHHRPHRRSAHTNPLHSLQSALQGVRPLSNATHPCTGGTSAAVPESVALESVCPAQTLDRRPAASAAAAQAHPSWMLERQSRRERDIVSGVCSLLGQRLTGGEQAQVPDSFWQQRHSGRMQSLPRTAQMLAGTACHQQVQPGCPVSPAVDHAHPLPNQHLASQLPSKEAKPADRPQVSFDVHLDDALQADSSRLATLPSAHTSIQCAPLTLAAPPPQHQPSTTATPLTATNPVSQPANTCLPEQAAQPPESSSNALQTSLTVPSVADLLQSWSNPSMRPDTSRCIADLASVCGSAARTVVPSAITRGDFEQAVTLRQMENKFIAMVSNGVLCVVDQHAADERVRLEALRAAVLGSQVTM